MAAPREKRALDFRSFDEILDDVSMLQNEGYRKLGNWSLSQICEHLTHFMEQSLHGFEFQFPWVLRKVAGPLMLHWVLKNRRLPGTLEAPRPIRPTGPPDDPARIERFRQVLLEVRDARSFFPSPGLGDLTPAQWRQIHLIHASHHLAFLIPGGKPATEPAPHSEPATKSP